jgi:hypothetical protein
MRSFGLCAAVIVLAALPATSRAQVAKKTADKTLRGAAAQCKIPNSAPWIAKQNAWFGEPGQRWTDDTLRTQLMAAAGIEGLLVPPVDLGAEFRKEIFAPTPTARAMVDVLTKLSSTRGSVWPTKTVVGAAGVHSVFILAHLDTTLAKAVLRRMMEAGPAESPESDVATLEDRVRVAAGKKQLYGTQMMFANGAISLAQMEDSAHVDFRRDAAGLPPLKTSLCIARYFK